MAKRLVLALWCALAVSACTSIRVSGFVTDEHTGEPVGTCGVVIGERYAHTDSAGHYVVPARRTWTTMQLIAPGYEPRTVPVDSSKTRYPRVDVQLTPKKKPKQAEVERKP